jgi:hydroxyacylglutathione hydrolase
MITQAFPSGPFGTNAYVVACPQTRLAALVDPAPESYHDVIEFLEHNKLTLDKILLTHSHWDHIADTARFKEKYDVPIYIHPLDQPNLENPGADGLPCWLSFPGVIPDVLINEGDVIPLGNLKFSVIHTPGHTPGGVCFYCPTESVLLSGDTLFQGTIGNISFPTARPQLMWPSLAKLAKLPPETNVLPGHGPMTTIGAENWLPNAEKIFGNY